MTRTIRAWWKEDGRWWWSCNGATVAALFALALIIVGCVLWARHDYRIQSGCLRAGWPRYDVTGTGYCLATINATEVVVPLAQVEAYGLPH